MEHEESVKREKSGIQGEHERQKREMREKKR